MKKIFNLKNIIFHLFLVFFLNLSLVSNSNSSINSNDDQSVRVYFCKYKNGNYEMYPRLQECPSGQNGHSFNEWRNQFPKTNWGRNKKICYDPVFKYINQTLDCKKLYTGSGNWIELTNLISENPNIFSISNKVNNSKTFLASADKEDQIGIVFCQFNHVGDSEWSSYSVDALVYGQNTTNKNCKDNVKKYHLDFKTAKVFKKADVCYNTSTQNAFVRIKSIPNNCNKLGSDWKLLEFVGDNDGLNRFKIKEARVFLASTDKNVSKYITKKKSNNTKAIEDIENLYSEGLLSKDECIRAKVKILKLPNASSTLCDNVNVKVLHKDDKPKEVEKKSTFITKKEPSTVKKDVKIYASLGELPFSSFYFYALDKNKNYLIGFVNPDPNSESKVVNNVSYRVGNLGYMYTQDGNVCDVYSTVNNARSRTIYTGSVEIKCLQNFYTGNWVQNGEIGSGKAIDDDGNFIDFRFFKQKSLAISEFEKQNESIIVKQDSQKEQEVVKVYRPKDSVSDTEAPKIETKLKIVSNSPNFTVEGIIKDNINHKDGPYLEISDQIISFDKKTGKFKKDLYSPFSTQITIAATDTFGNRNEIVVEVEIKEQTVIAEKLEPLNPSKIRRNVNPNTVAIIIGIEKYDKIVSSPYSNLDAKYFTEYVKNVASSNNIITLVDDKASRNESMVALVKDLRAKINPEVSDVLIFFSGHGLAANEKDLYLMTNDSDSDLLEFTALNRQEIIKIVASYKPKSVTMFLDTCYSGVSRKGEQLIASARPIRVQASDNASIPENFNIFSASQSTQVSSSIDQAKQGIFSYYLMKGLEGKADVNNDRSITNGELFAYLKNNVSKKALETYSRDQIPSFRGSEELVIWKY
jgi:hypothetical protein